MSHDDRWTAGVATAGLIGAGIHVMVDPREDVDQIVEQAEGQAAEAVGSPAGPPGQAARC